MPGTGPGTRTRGLPQQGSDRPTASTRPAAGRRVRTEEAAGGTRKPDETGSGARRGHNSLRDLLRGLRAGDLETVLLTVAMAADENRMPSADPNEAKRILRFLTRLAGHDPGLPPSPRWRGPRPGPHV